MQTAAVRATTTPAALIHCGNRPALSASGIQVLVVPIGDP